MFVSKRHSKIVTTEASFRLLLERLHIENVIYSPYHSKKKMESYSRSKHETEDDCSNIRYFKSTDLEISKKRILWQIIDEVTVLSNFSVNSYTKGHGNDDNHTKSFQNEKRERQIRKSYESNDVEEQECFWYQI